jgi:hypothetical protein
VSSAQILADELDRYQLRILELAAELEAGMQKRRARQLAAELRGFVSGSVERTMQKLVQAADATEG